MNKKTQYKSKRMLRDESLRKKTIIKTALLLPLCIGIFFASMYGFRCFVTKVCGNEYVNRLVRDTYTVLMPKGALEVEVANTKASRELGLSGRKSMKDDQGLLFVFDVPGRYGFWMKDMAFPLDLIWINEDGIVVSIERDVATSTYPKVFMNQSQATYVLEINAGLAQKFGLYLGSKVKMTD